MVPAPQSRKMHSVFFTIFFSLLLVLVIELTLLIGTIVVGQVPSQLDDNAEEVLCEQVANRSGYLQNFCNFLIGATFVKMKIHGDSLNVGKLHELIIELPFVVGKRV